MDAKQRFEAWLQDEQIDTETKEELKAIAHDESEIQDRFSQPLAFGTGGLRGKIGAGANRMNRYTVRLATQALANVLIQQGHQQQGVVVACDSRIMSQEFVEESAAVLVGNGIPVYVFEKITPTPVLSFAVRHLNACGGILVTASHNPPEYNGYKAYGADGIQLLTDFANQVSEEMEGLALGDVHVHPAANQTDQWTSVGEDVYQAYFDAVQQVAVVLPEQDTSLHVLYTPLHGTGGEFVPRALKAAGFSHVDCVDEQMVPDGHFPTVKSPNPEETESFRLAFSYAGDGKYELILATDPDADRVGIAVWNNEGYVLLNGNQVGVLLADYLLQIRPASQQAVPVIVTTIVSTAMIQPVAKRYGAQVIKTLTGFKYIGEQMNLLDGQEREFLFGFEESYGYLAGVYARDKDAVIASLLITQMAAYYKTKGVSLVERFTELMDEHGFYVESLRSYSFATNMEAKKAQEFIEGLRREPMRTIAGEEIQYVRDYQGGSEKDLVNNKEQPIHLPEADVLQWETTRGDRITLRPSGTEPKMKLYTHAVGSSALEAQERLQALEQAFDDLVAKGLEG